MKKGISYVGLALVFCTTLFLWAKCVLVGLPWVFDRLFRLRLCWNDAPLLELILGGGAGGVLGWIVAVGARNRFRHRPFLDTINWQKLLVVVFCLCMWMHLSTEVDALVPQLAGIEFEFDPDYGYPNPMGWLTTPLLVAMYFIGKGLWPAPHYWVCQTCGKINTWEMRECTYQDCTQFRSIAKLSESEMQALRKSRQQTPEGEPR